MKDIVCYDFYAGAGGVTEGLKRASERIPGIKLNVTAINHWDVAIATHSKNHPDARHLCTGVDNINIHTMQKPGSVDLAWFSPECIFFSRARGGKPVNDQRRASAWCVTRFAEAWLPRAILVENVPEFTEWGPLVRRRKSVKIMVPKLSFEAWLKRRTGRVPSSKSALAQLKSLRREWEEKCPKRERMVLRDCYVPEERHKCETFHAWVNVLRSLGYRVEWRVLCAADYGCPTTRQRLFVYAVRGKLKINWPEPTHAPRKSFDESDLFSTRKPWRPAAEIIDWTDRGSSIYTRKRDLAPKTLERIYIGLNKFGGLPFIIGNQSCSAPRQTVDPVCTITGEGGRGMGLVQPFLVGRDCSPSSPLVRLDQATLPQPFLVKLRGTNDSADINEPSPTVTASGGTLGLCSPFLVCPSHGNGKDEHGNEKPSHPNRARSIDDPLATVSAGGKQWALATPYLVKTNHSDKKNAKGDSPSHRVRSVDDPLPTVAGNRGEWAKVQPFLIAIDNKGKSNGSTANSTLDPLTTVTSKQRHALCEPFIISYYGSSGASVVTEPCPTVTTKDRFALVSPELRPQLEIDGEIYLLEILFRMLKETEIAGAQDFQPGYHFTGNKTEIVKQIGNAVPPGLVAALTQTVLEQFA